jgi:hypothetical protein
MILLTPPLPRAHAVVSLRAGARSIAKLAADSSLPRDVSLFSFNLQSTQVSQMPQMAYFTSPELPALLPPMGLDRLDPQDADVRTLLEAYHVSNQVNASLSGPGAASASATVPLQVRQHAVKRLQALRGKLAERLQRDAHERPAECAALLAAERASSLSSTTALSLATLSPAMARIARRRRFLSLIQEIEGQVRPLASARASAASLSASDLAARVLSPAEPVVEVEAAVVNLDGEATAAETLEALNRNARKPRAANKGKRPVVCVGPILSFPSHFNRRRALPIFSSCGVFLNSLCLLVSSMSSRRATRPGD